MSSHLIMALFSVMGINVVLANTIWPHVAESKFGNDDVSIQRNVEFITKGQTIKTLTAAYERYQLLMFPHATGDASLAASTITYVNVEVDDPSEAYPQLDTDESYDLTVSPTAATITSKTVYGALRALESFSQLVVFDYDTETYVIASCPLYVKDAPRYPHRGMLLDTSRHFQPLAEIERTIDALSYAKYNGTVWRYGMI